MKYLACEISFKSSFHIWVDVEKSKQFSVKVAEFFNEDQCDLCEKTPSFIGMVEASSQEDAIEKVRQGEWISKLEIPYDLVQDDIPAMEKVVELIVRNQMKHGSVVRCSAYVSDEELLEMSCAERFCTKYASKGTAYCNMHLHGADKKLPLDLAERKFELDRQLERDR